MVWSTFLNVCPFHRGGGGLKLFEQWPDRTNTFQKGTSLSLISVVTFWGKSSQKKTPCFRHCPNGGEGVPFPNSFCHFCEKLPKLMFKTLHSKPNDWNQKNITQDYVWFSRRLSFYLREKCQGMWRVAVMPPSIKTRVGWCSREGFNACQGRQTHTHVHGLINTCWKISTIEKVEIIFFHSLF